MRSIQTSPSSGFRYQKHTIPQLIRVYRLIEKYMADNDGDAPAIADLVRMGASPSTSVVRRYKMQMRDLGMIQYRDKISRSLRLLPLDEADEQVIEYLRKHSLDVVLQP